MDASHRPKSKRVLGLACVVALIAIWISLARLEDPATQSPAEDFQDSRLPSSATHLVVEPLSVDAKRSPIPADPSGPRLAQLSFVNEQGLPLPGCRLSVVDAGDEHGIGAANDSGVLTLDAALLAGKHLLARHDHYKPQLFRVPDSVEAQTITLESLGVIRGEVRLQDGAVPTDPMMVAAYEDNDPPPCSELTAAPASGRWHKSATDSTGVFVIPDLDRSKLYSITGAGSGYVLDGPKEHVAPSDAMVLLTALPLYGVRVSVVDSPGKPIAIGKGVHVAQGGGMRCLDSTAREVNLANEVAMAGIDGVDCIEVEDPNSFVLTYVSNSDKVGIPLLIAIHRPGYQPTRAAVRAPRLTGPLVTHEIRLERDESPSGSVRVQLQFGGGRILTSGGVSLTPVTGGASYYLKLHDLTNEPVEFDSVPAGEYTCVVRLFDTLLRVRSNELGSPITVTVSPQQTAFIGIDLVRFGRVNIRLFDQWGVEYAGAATFRTLDAGRAVSFVRFDSAPYTLFAHDSGRLSIAGSKGRGGNHRSGDEEFHSEVDVVAGESIEVQIGSRFQAVLDLRR